MEPINDPTQPPQPDVPPTPMPEPMPEPAPELPSLADTLKADAASGAGHDAAPGAASYIPLDYAAEKRYKVTAPVELLQRVGGTIENAGLNKAFFLARSQRLGTGADARIVTSDEQRTHVLMLSHSTAASLEHDGYEVSPSPAQEERDDYTAGEQDRAAKAAAMRAEAEARHASDLKTAQDTLSGQPEAAPEQPRKKNR